jgi:hypothetical protein
LENGAQIGVFAASEGDQLPYSVLFNQPVAEASSNGDPETLPTLVFVPDPTG